MSTSFTTDRAVRIMAGSFILISLALGVEASPVFVSKNFLWFTAFVGANLLQSSLTRWCLMEDILAKLGVAKKTCSVDASQTQPN